MFDWDSIDSMKKWEGQTRCHVSNISAEIMIDFTTRVTSLCNATSLIRANEGSTSQISGFIFGVFAGVGYFSSTDLILSRETWVHMPVLITCATLSFIFAPVWSFKKKILATRSGRFLRLPVLHPHHPNQHLHLY